MSVRSMTGYARVRKPLGTGELVASVKSVNHRGLDLHFQMPPELEVFENAIRAAVKQRVARGHLQVRVRASNTQQRAPAVVNQALLETYLTAFRRVSAIHGLGAQPDLNAAFQIPGMLEAGEAEPNPEMEAVLVEALEECLASLNEFREREGGEMAAEIRSRNAVVRECVRRMEEIRSQALPALEARLRERLGELLKEAAIDPQRLAQEAAFLADRSDISEELTRLKVHAQQIEDLLKGSEEVGKKLDFLLQEMQREANTILSKAVGVGELGLAITELALKAKSEIEKIREQAGNLE